MYKIKNTKSILNEWNNFLNKNSLLKEEYDPSTGKLTIYHLTGLDKFRQYNSDVNRRNKTIDDWQPDQYSGDPSNRTSRIMNRLRNQKPKKMSDAEIVASSLKSLISYPFTNGTGFTPGAGAMYGPALYTCYEFNPDIVHTYGDIAIKFETDISGFLIFFEDVAKQVYGDNWEIKDQLRLLLTDRIDDHTIDNIVNRRIENIKHTKMFGDYTTSDIAFKISKLLFENLSYVQIKNNIKGLIFRGNHDGPVCVVYNPKRDVNIVELGKVETVIDKISKNIISTNIIWRDNLTTFVDLYRKEGDDYIPTDDISFERMNQLQQEKDDIDDTDYFVTTFNKYKLLINLYKTKQTHLNLNDLNAQFLNNLKKMKLTKHTLTDVDMFKYFSNEIIIFLLNSSLNIKLSDEILIYLSNKDDILIKQLIITNVNNYKINKQIIEKCLNDPNPEIVTMLLDSFEDIKHAKLKEIIIEKIFNKTDLNIRNFILDNFESIESNKLRQEILENYSNDSNVNIRELVLENIESIQNKELQEKILEKFSNDVSSIIRNIVLQKIDLIEDFNKKQLILKTSVNDPYIKTKITALNKIDQIEDIMFRDSILKKYSNSTDLQILNIVFIKINLIENEQLKQEALENLVNFIMNINIVNDETSVIDNNNKINFIISIINNINLIQNKELELSIFEKYSNTTNDNIKTSIVRSKNCPYDILKKLTKSKSMLIKINIISNPNCDIEILKLLQKDKDKNIRNLIALSPKCDIELLNILSNDINQDVKTSVALNVNCTFDLCNKIISQFNLKQKKQILRNFFNNFSLNYKNVLNILSNDIEPSIRFLAIKHYECTKQIAIKLSNDLDQKVKKAALKRLKLNDLKENFNLLRSYLKLLIN